MSGEPRSEYCTAGLYYCVAKNARGIVNKSLELEVYCKFSIFVCRHSVVMLCSCRCSECDDDGLADHGDRGRGLPDTDLRGNPDWPSTSQSVSFCSNMKVDANPAATVKWIKNLNLPGEEVIGLGPMISISTVRRGNAGTYNCVATNSVGTSLP